MSGKPLDGLKVAALVESRYIPEELRVYDQKLSGYGATCHFIPACGGGPS
jgi:hypothetical protein